MVHSVKIEPQHYEAVKNGTKTFEIRKNDRDYRVNDYIALNEYDNEHYTGRSLLCKITYIISDERFCKEGFVTLAIRIHKELFGGKREYENEKATIPKEISDAINQQKESLDTLKQKVGYFYG